jgi:hypothetical protein
MGGRDTPWCYPAAWTPPTSHSPLDPPSITTMFVRSFAAATFASLVLGQQVGTNTAEKHPALPIQVCTGSGSCKTESTSVVLDVSILCLHNCTHSTLSNMHLTLLVSPTGDGRTSRLATPTATTATHGMRPLARTERHVLPTVPSTEPTTKRRTVSRRLSLAPSSSSS